MSYARSGMDGSTVYVIADVRGGFTCFCEPIFRCATRRQMIAHLDTHEARGGNAQCALAGLRAELWMEAAR